MKKCLYILLLVVNSLFSQTPESLNYQAVVRDNSGDLISNSDVGFQFNLLQGTISGTVVYSETQSLTTSNEGIVNAKIGIGTTSDDFSNINWETGPYFLQVGVDLSNGTNYNVIGTNELLSVPYALQAKKAEISTSIVLTSPNGTEYEVTVNDDGELSLPTSNQPANIPTSLYLYGSFNNWDATSALQFGYDIPPYDNQFIGMKYFTAGTEIKFLAAQNENIVYGGNGLSGEITEGGSAITIPNDGFYRVTVSEQQTGPSTFVLYFNIDSINVSFNSNQTMIYSGTPNVFLLTTNTWNSVANSFRVGSVFYGDNLADGSLEHNGTDINISNAFSTIFIDLTINFNSSATYQITPF